MLLGKAKLFGFEVTCTLPAIDSLYTAYVRTSMPGGNKDLKTDSMIRNTVHKIAHQNSDSVEIENEGHRFKCPYGRI